MIILYGLFQLLIISEPSRMLSSILGRFSLSAIYTTVQTCEGTSETLVGIRFTQIQTITMNTNNPLVQQKAETILLIFHTKLEPNLPSQTVFARVSPTPHGTLTSEMTRKHWKMLCRTRWQRPWLAGSFLCRVVLPSAPPSENSANNVR